MGLASMTGHVTRPSYDGIQWSEAELALFEVAALLAGAVIRVLRVVDTVYAAWPLPTSRVRRRPAPSSRPGDARSRRPSARSTR